MGLSTRSQFFTLHIWLEELEPHRHEWRGRVRHVPSGNLCYFRDWQTLATFLERFSVSLGEPPASDSGNRQTLDNAL